jgi:hypothetical protein
MNLGHKRTQIKLPASDGKFYLYDVIDHKQLVYLIKLIAHKNAYHFKKWLISLNKFQVRQQIIELLGIELRLIITSQVKIHIGHIIIRYIYIKKHFQINKTCSTYNNLILKPKYYNKT